jgi:iron complex outermembrane receptor protein
MPSVHHTKDRTTTRCRNTVATLGMVGLSSLACAGDGVGYEGEDYLSDIPVVLTITRLPQSMAELPTAVTVIDREMIEASGAVALTDLFRLVAGFQLGHYHGPEGSRTAVTYHGNTNQYARRMQVLIDGRSIYTWGTGGAEWSDLPVAIDDIERIEVSRGPNGVTYGSNAFLGVIHIITRHPSTQRGTRATVTLDDDQYRETALRHAGGSGDFTYRLSGSYKEDDGFEEYTSPTGTLYERNDDSDTVGLTFRGDYRGGVNDYLTLQFGAARGGRGTGFSYDPADPLREREMEVNYQQVKWQHIIDSESEVNVQFYHNLHQVTDKFDTAPLSQLHTYYYDYEGNCLPVPTEVQCLLYPFDSADLALIGLEDQTLLRDTSMRSERYNLELSHRFRLTDATRLVWGGELRLDEVKAGDYFHTGERYQHQLVRLFFNGEWKPTSRWVVNLGEMVEQSTLVGALHSPRLAINRLVGESGYARVGAGRAYRMPTATEEHANFTFHYPDGTVLHQLYDSPGGLDPERIDSVEFAMGAERGGAGYELKVFREEISAEINAVKNPASTADWTMAQGGTTTIEGAEIQLRARTADSLLSLAYAQTRASGQHLEAINPEETGETTEAVPRHTLNLLLSLRLGAGLWAGLNYYSVSPMRFYSGDTTQGVQSADFTLSKSFELSGHPAKLRFVVKDLLGSYFDFEDETVSRKRSYLTLQMDF